jgi:hypothetical protein
MSQENQKIKIAAKLKKYQNSLTAWQNASRLEV